MKKTIFALIILGGLAACRKYDNPEPNPTESEELSLVLDSYTGLYNVHITREVRDAQGQVTSTEIDSIAVLSRANETSLEMIQKVVEFNPSQSQPPLYQASPFYYLSNPNNNSNIYQNLTLYKETPKRIVYVMYEGDRSGSVTSTFEGILQ